MRGLGTNLGRLSAITEPRLLTTYGVLIKQLRPYPLIPVMMSAGLVFCIVPGIWREAGNASGRRLFIACSLSFCMVILFVASHDRGVRFNYLALLMPFWYIFSGAGIAWLLTSRIFSGQLLDRNLSILLSVFLAVTVVAWYDQDNLILSRRRYTLWDLYKDGRRGRIVEDAEAGLGYCYSMGPGGEGQCVVFGPYHVLFPGKYHCEFRLKLGLDVEQIGKDLDKEVGHLDVAARAGALIVAERPIRAQDMVPLGKYRSLAIDFELSCLEKVEYRVWTKGRGGLCFDSVKITRR